MKLLCGYVTDAEARELLSPFLKIRHKCPFTISFWEQADPAFEMDVVDAGFTDGSLPVLIVQLGYNSVKTECRTAEEAEEACSEIIEQR